MPKVHKELKLDEEQTIVRELEKEVKKEIDLGQK